MDLLVLDTIHGGTLIGHELSRTGHHVDCVDVYRHGGTVSPSVAAGRMYDQVIAPVHLDPDHPLLLRAPRVISHHDAVRWILGDQKGGPVVEVTGARGKTTTAHAISHILPGPGILHSSTGTLRRPEGRVYTRQSITPASVISAKRTADAENAWLVAEVSLGFCGIGSIGILTSSDTYRFASGKRDALTEKSRSAGRMRLVVVPPDMPESGPNMIPADEIVRADEGSCRYSWEGISGSFSHPLLTDESYHLPLTLAAAAGCLMGIDPSGLATFTPVDGRMAVSRVSGRTIVDNANSGTCRASTIAACRRAKELVPTGPLTLVIGEEGHAVCEGFAPDDVLATIVEVRPDRVIIVGLNPEISRIANRICPTMPFPTLEDARMAIRNDREDGSVVLAVKTWR